MNPSCTQERKFIKLKRFPTNVTSKQYMQKSEKLRSTPTSFTHIVMQIIQRDISDRLSDNSKVLIPRHDALPICA